MWWVGGGRGREKAGRGDRLCVHDLCGSMKPMEERPRVPPVVRRRAEFEDAVHPDLLAEPVEPFAAVTHDVCDGAEGSASE